MAVLHTLLRDWRRQPGFVLAVLLALSIGVAAVTTVVALIEATLLRPLPVASGERLLQVHRVGSERASLSLPDVMALRERLSLLDGMAIQRFWPVDAAAPAGGSARKLNGLLTESAYFDLLELTPLHGRVLQAADDRAGAVPVAVLSEALWRRDYGADPAIIGRSLRLSGVDTQIVGVVSAAADLADQGIELWLPTPGFAPWALSSPGSNNFDVWARLGAGVQTTAAQAELNTVIDRLIAEGILGEHKRLALRSLQDQLSAGSRPALWLLSGFAALLLLLACINVGALLLVRMATRSAEMQVRLALGAGAAQLRRQLLGEALALAVPGALLGCALAWTAFLGIQQFAAAALPRLAGSQPGWISWSVALLSSVMICVGVVLLAGQQFMRRLRSGSGLRAQRSVGGISQKLLGLLISAEVSVAVVLLCGSALLLRSFVALVQVPLGFVPDSALTAELVLPESRYGDMAQQSAAVSGIVDQLGRTPGVTHAAFVVGLPLVASGSVSHSFLLEHNETSTAESSQAGVEFRAFHGDYFSTAGIPILSGRGIEASDQADGPPIAWVNAAFAKRWLGDQAPLEQRIAWVPGEAGPAENGPRWMRIVGVVGDTRSSSPRQQDAPAVYLPYLQREDNWMRFGQLLVRTQPDAVPDSAIQAAVTSVDPDIVLPPVRSWSERVAFATRQERLNLGVASSFALIALLLGLQGMVGLLAYAIARRRDEMALRLALGATAAQLQRASVRRGMWHAAIGVICGLIVAWMLAELARSLLFGISSSDPLSYLTVGVLCLLFSALACWWPSRALRNIAPAQALKAQ